MALQGESLWSQGGRTSAQEILDGFQHSSTYIILVHVFGSFWLKSEECKNFKILHFTYNVYYAEGNLARALHHGLI